jgi:hypothetical protein
MPGVSKPLRSSYKAYAFDVDVVIQQMVARKWLATADVPMRPSRGVPYDFSVA